MARHRQRARDRKRQEDANSGEIHHENVSGELEKISGEVEEFDASLIQGAEGEPDPIDEEELTAIEEASEPSDDPDVEEARRPRAAAGPRPGGNRVLNFLRASWAELQRVQWPDRRQVAQATAVVLGFVAIAGAYLGLADAAAQKIVDYII